ncbi:MAG: hypothetical protein IJI67_01395 [Clostridia bacterium]|nr:hypothetical protein [Clostridia bacterium]
MNSARDQRALLYRLWEEHQKQDARTVAQSVRDARAAGSIPKPADDEKLQMTETKIYIGLNDSQTKEQKYTTEKYMSVLKNVCRNYHVAFSVDIEEGGYFHDDGEYTEETSFVLVLIDAQKKVVKEIAKDLCVFFHQESVLVTEEKINGFFINGKELQ